MTWHGRGMAWHGRGMAWHDMIGTGHDIPSYCALQLYEVSFKYM